MNSANKWVIARLSVLDRELFSFPFGYLGSLWPSLRSLGDMRFDGFARHDL